MGKNIFFGILILLSVVLILFFVIFTDSQIDEVKFNQYLNEGHFEKAYKTYSKAEKEYQQVFETYIDEVIDNYNASVISYEGTLLLFDELTNLGFPKEIMENGKDRIQTLHKSKEIYENGETLFNEAQLLKAKEYYCLIITADINFSDAQEKIKLIDENIASYQEADTLYLSNKFELAYDIYKSIINSKINTDVAKNKVAIIENINTAWQDEFQGEAYDKCTYPYQAVSKNDYIYLPYSKDNTHSIVKYNLSTESCEVFVIAKIPCFFVINDINVVGDYLYFIAGENVGNGKFISNPYNIYRMKNDGTNLECIAKGDYKNLIAYKDGFYISSYSQGLVKFDRNFTVSEQISEDTPVQIQLVMDKLYFTVDAHDPYRPINSLLVYDGCETVEVRRKTRLRFGFYSDAELYTYRAGDFYCEKLFISNDAENKNYLLKFDDFRDLYGIVGDKILYSKEEIRGQIKYYIMNPNDSESTDLSHRLPVETGALQKICFENELLVFSSSNGFILTDNEYNVMKEIDLSEKNILTIYLDEQSNFAYTDIYTSEEVVTVEEGFWYYSNNECNIRIEERYMYNVDTNVYIAHIRTTNPNCLQIGSPSGDTHLTGIRKYPTALARQYSAIFACSGDFFDQNMWTGISIRNGLVYKDELLQDMMAIYPDGNLICYNSEDEIICEKLISQGVNDTLSFGPILLSGGEYGNDLFTNFIAHPNPRNGIGMVEPGHYVVILADGRQPDSAGLSLKSMADLFEAEGCIEAYNLDGGQSATMLFMGEFVNTHIHNYSGIFFRSLPEIIYFGTSELVPD